MEVINPEINCTHQSPFPKARKRLLSFYTYRSFYVRIMDNGYFNKSQLVASLIDFSFVRSLVADAYSSEGGHCYDPVSLFLCELFRFLDAVPTMRDFCKLLNDEDMGHLYRLYTGISYPNIPCEADFSNFKIKIGENRFNQIFQTLVAFLVRLGLITARILSHDGTLVPSCSRYRGCNYASQECFNIRVGSDFFSLSRHRISSLIAHKLIPPDKVFRSYARCPKSPLPNDVKPPCIKVIEYKLVPFDPALVNPKDVSAKIIGIEDILKAANLLFIPVHSNISFIDLNLQNNPVFVKCPRIPSDLQAKIGCRRAKHNPDKTEKVFGYMSAISTSIEPELGTEFPVACLTEPASTHDGQLLPLLKEQIRFAHPILKTRIDIGDSGFDSIHNYNWIRAEGSIPIIDFNRRGEKFSPEKLFDRGFDQNGTPFAPCHILCKSNGFDSKDNRLSFVCAKQCLTLPPGSIPIPIPDCSHLAHPSGFSCHIPISKNPRLFCEIPRGSNRWRKTRMLRPASERTNSSAKSDLDILAHPRTRGSKRMAVLAQYTCMTILLSRFVNLVVKIHLKIRKLFSSDDGALAKFLRFRLLPRFIRFTIQRK